MAPAYMYRRRGGGGAMCGRGAGRGRIAVRHSSLRRAGYRKLYCEAAKWPVQIAGAAQNILRCGALWHGATGATSMGRRTLYGMSYQRGIDQT
eukprot:SAG31_NODE_8878_length_1369_cov_1.056693_1_plen_92_part_01